MSFLGIGSVLFDRRNRALLLKFMPGCDNASVEGLPLVRVVR